MAKTLLDVNIQNSAAAETTWMFSS